MKPYFIKSNIYETQALLYFILGELILHLGTLKWLGWVCVGYGIFTFVSAILIVVDVTKDKSNEKHD